MEMIGEEVYSVSRLTRIIRNLLEDGIPLVWVEGEISNCTLHRSGHRYFTLKDAAAQISCVMWRTRSKPGFELKDGLKVKAYGKVTVWEQGGRYQLDVQSIYPVGIGSLQAAFEELKRKLGAEGLFDIARKRALPKFPRGVGIATSPTGAAIRDLSWGFSTRFPPAELFLIPVKVQGEGAAAEITHAIESFNRSGLVDVIVIGRGGGSIEDLWAFNEEILVRAVVASRIPVVSAVGHEVDVTLCDLAADLRAPTPTAAAALVVPDREDLKGAISEKGTNIARSLSQTITLWREKINSISTSYQIRRVVGRIAEARMRFDNVNQQIEDLMNKRICDLKRWIDFSGQRLTGLSPVRILDRGYCVARKQDRTIVKSSQDISVDEKLDIGFKQGRALAVVEKIIN